MNDETKQMAIMLAIAVAAAVGFVTAMGIVAVFIAKIAG